MILNVRLPNAKYKLPVEVIPEGDRYALKFKYSPPMIAEVKSMDGAKWHGFEDPPRKIWSIKNSPRNNFVLDYMQDKPVYARWDSPLRTDIIFATERKRMAHQAEMIIFGLTRRRCIIAGEMGTGKTLAAIEIMELSGHTDWWWVGTKSSLKATALELKKWKSSVTPKLLTYENLVSTLKNWPTGQKPPKGIIMDECARVKTPTSQRSEAAKHLSDNMALEYKGEEYVVLMSGAPAPKDPADWWHQCEVAQPGFIREGTYGKFKERLCLTDSATSVAGGTYKKLITWWDDEKKCKKCGKLDTDDCHNAEQSVFGTGPYHAFIPSINEVAHLYKRLEGLVYVKFKKDCMDLPEKRFEVVELPISKSTIRVAQTIAKTARSTVVALTSLRELSDGFQYIDVPIGEELCPVCNGSCEKDIWVDPKNPERPLFDVQDETGLEKRKARCDCKNGMVPKYERRTEEIPCPKDDELIKDLENHEDVGRLVIYGGFTGTIDRIVKLCHKEGWATLRIDGRGWLLQNFNGDIIPEKNHLEIFQEMKEFIPKLAICAHPRSAGTGLTLTAAPTEIYYSNDFDGDARIQSMDRIHRPGMDVNRGATIKDYIHLPTDRVVLNNLMKKVDLQNLSLGVVKEALENVSEERAL